MATIIFFILFCIIIALLSKCVNTLRDIHKEQEHIRSLLQSSILKPDVESDKPFELPESTTTSLAELNKDDEKLC